MTRYYFNIRNGDTVIVDNEGIDLPNIKAALVEAEECARELLAERIRSGAPITREVFEVLDDLDNRLFTIRLTSVLRLE